MITCFDLALMPIEERTNELASSEKINEEKLDILREYCEAIDSIVEHFSGVSAIAKVNDDNNVVISLECEEIVTVDNPSRDSLIQLFDRAISVGFSTTNGENVVMEFVFPSVWDKSEV